MKLWTTRSVYNATGEGETVLACIGHADNAEEAKAAFVKIFGEFFGPFSVSVEGVSRDSVIELLFSRNCSGRWQVSKGGPPWSRTPCFTSTAADAHATQGPVDQDKLDRTRTEAVVGTEGSVGLAEWLLDL